MRTFSVRQFVVLYVLVFFFCEGYGFRLSGYYIGCLEKSGFSKDITSYSPPIDATKFVPRLCYEACFKQKFKLAGLRLGNKCYCTNSTLDLSKKAEEEYCDYTCPGDDTKYCGGDLYRNVYATGLTASDNGLQFSGRHFGCFEIEGFSQDKAAFSDPKSLTPKVCYESCFQKGFLFAGLRHGDRCHCFNTKPDLSRRVEETNCEASCPGDENLSCGGGYHQNIFATGLTASGFQPNGEYVGCFHKDGFPKDKQTFFPYFDDTNLTPKYCYELCFWNGFKLARLQFGEKCICSNAVLDMSKKTEETDCDNWCPGDKNVQCGGSLHPNVYSTGLSDIPATGHLIGCFPETTNATGEPNQCLPDFREDLYETNSPGTCMNLCHQLGFSFAGLQAGYVCRCGNTRPGANEMRPEVECDRQCTGSSSERCGGHQRISVYKTPKADEPEGSEAVASPSTRRPVPLSVDPTTEGYCAPSATRYNNIPACKNAVIFYDDFSQLDSSKWLSEVKIANKPDYEFTVYDTKPENLFTEQGALHIQPTINDEYFVESGNIQFEGSRCTGNKVDGECSKNTDFSILPPIQSARITTRQSFNFKYGVIEIQAKLPVGAWIVPEISLMPADNTYGPSYNSGKIRFVSRGNPNLKSEEGREIGYRRVEGSVTIGHGDSVKNKAAVYFNEKGWRDQFHNFTIIWRPDDILFVVDGKRTQSMMLNSNTNRLVDAVGLSSSKIKIWSAGSNIAPFDQPFYISLGVHAGGIRDFEDNIGSSTDRISKPWSNTDPKAMLKFWQHRNEWKPTWKEDTSLVIKSIKVTAL